MSIDTVPERAVGNYCSAGFIKTGSDVLSSQLPVHAQGHLAVKAHCQPPYSIAVILQLQPVNLHRILQGDKGPQRLLDAPAVVEKPGVTLPVSGDIGFPFPNR